ncbi:MAG: hypothetical protein ABEJ84_03035 [Halodesulfurarchaeum sp.]
MSEDLTDVKFVGPATEAVLERAGIEAAAIRERRVSHTQLVDAGVNPGVAAKIRREHSLSWSLEGGEDLDRRADQVRGLKAGEREWVAASASDWDGKVASGRGGTDQDDTQPTWERRPWPNQPDVEREFDAEAEWREQSEPTPISAIPALDGEAESALREAGINSVRRLASCNPEAVADSLAIDEEIVRKWRNAARAVE